MGAVQALGFKALRQAQIQQHHVGLPGQQRRVVSQAVVGAVKALKALGVADVLGEVILHQGQGFFHLDSIHHAAARALIPGVRREIADHRHPSGGIDGQGVPFIL